jgi:hypothetical protein
MLDSAFIINGMLQSVDLSAPQNPSLPTPSLLHTQAATVSQRGDVYHMHGKPPAGLKITRSSPSLTSQSRYAPSLNTSILIPRSQARSTFLDPLPDRVSEHGNSQRLNTPLWEVGVFD